MLVILLGVRGSPQRFPGGQSQRPSLCHVLREVLVCPLTIS